MSKLTMRFKSIVDKLLRTGFFHIFGSNTINQIIGFSYSILIARVIPKSNFGLFKYTNNIYAMFMLASGFGIASAVLQLCSEYSEDKHRSEAIFDYGYGFGLRFNLLLSITILLISFFVDMPIEGSGALLRMMFILPVTSLTIELQKIWLRINYRNKEFSHINTINSFLIALLSLGGAAILKEQGIIISHYIVAAITIVLLARMPNMHILPRRSKLPPEDKRDLFKIAGVSVLNNGLGELISLFGTFMLGLILSDESAIAAYSVASTIPGALTFIPISLMAYVYPHFARNRNNKQWVRDRFKTLLLYAGLGNLIITVGGIIFSGPFMHLFGSDYTDAIRPFQILMLSFFVSGTFRVIAGNLIVTQRKLMFNLIMSIVGAIVSAGCNYLLIPSLGSEGAAISYLITMTVTGIMATGYLLFILRKNKTN